MSVLLKSRRLRRKSIVRWMLLVALLAFFIAQIKPVEGLSTLLLVGIITASVIIPLTLVHIILGFWQGRRRRRRTASPRITAASEDFDKYKGTQSKPVAADSTQLVTHDKYEGLSLSEADVSEQANIAAVASVNTAPDLDLNTTNRNATFSQHGNTVGTTPDKASGPDRYAAESSAHDAVAVSAQGEVANTDSTAGTAPLEPPTILREDRIVDVSASSREPIDMDGTTTTPEILQSQIERIGHLVQTHDLGTPNTGGEYETHAGSIDNSRAEHSRLSVVRNNLITGNSFADTANPLELSPTQIVELVATLRKQKARLHRLVIAQQADIDSERENSERSRIVARDAFKSMRDLRKVQKNVEKQFRRERAKRKRIEEEYQKVSLALENAKSILASRESDSTSTL